MANKTGNNNNNRIKGTSGDAVLAAATQVGDDVVITKDAGNTITLENVLKANLSADDFSFFFIT